MDSMVLETQKWLNATYGNVSGFTPVPEDGQTGWPTIYGLIEGLQHELGITSLVENFGATTASLYDQKVTPNLKSGYTSNYIYLIQGAFWCKGINPVDFNGIFSDDTTTAIETLQTDAGMSVNGILDSSWAKALFDMSAFVLVPEGDGVIRSMQQYLNLHYSAYTGIMPTDGIYQRATNSAIVYGIQAELGLTTTVATGSFGPTTSSYYQQAFQSGLSTNLIKLLQFALYANMREYWASSNSTPPAFTGVLDSATTKGITDFQNFMALTPLNPVTLGKPDLTTTLSLVQSNGDPNRNFLACDTSLQLTPDMIDDLISFEVTYVGRYLTGTVGSNFVPKNLTRTEAENILTEQLSIIPIYQDNSPSAEYYTYDQGRSDARSAVLAAAKLGIPNGSFIYFAVDYDMLDSDIDTYVKPYFEGVQEIVTGNTNDFEYQTGVYGTRNVCSRLYHESNIERSYVANMSSGWSGNLGFSQPLDWAFDQFCETSYASVTALDCVTVSGLDEAVSELVTPLVTEENWILQFVQLLGWNPLNQKIVGGEVSLNAKIPLISTGFFDLDVTIYDTITSDGDVTVSSGITNGKIDDPEFSTTIANNLGNAGASANIVKTANEIIHGVQVGKVSATVSANSDGFEIDIKVDLEDIEDFAGDSTFSFSVELNFTVRTTGGSDDPSDWSNFLAFVKNHEGELIVGGLVLGCAIAAGPALLAAGAGELAATAVATLFYSTATELTTQGG